MTINRQSRRVSKRIIPARIIPARITVAALRNVPDCGKYTRIARLNRSRLPADHLRYDMRPFYRLYRDARRWSPSDFQHGAITAAFFTCDPNMSGGEYCLDWDETWNVLAPADRHRFIAACRRFERRYGRILSRICELTGNDMEHAGRDYYYSSAGHGCGFWDGDWKRFGDALSAACKRMPLPEIYADEPEVREALGDDAPVAYWLA